MRAAFPDPWVRQYSVKANDVPAVIAEVAARGFGANVVSRGEWALARRAGVPDDRITLEGIGKTAGDLRAAAGTARSPAPLRWVALESVDEAAALAGMVHARRARLDVLYRLNPDVTPETLAALAVGAGASKFGMTETEIADAIEAGGGPDGPLRPRGIHLHVGSQLGAVDAWRDAVRRGLAVTALWRGSIPTFDTLDVGGGFPVRPDGEPAPSPERFAREVPGLLAAIPADRRPTRLAIEPGRALVARAGWLVARVLHVRDRGGPQVILDAGMTELIRPALYGARHPIRALVDGPGTAARAASGTAWRASRRPGSRDRSASPPMRSASTTCRRSVAATSSRSRMPGHTRRRSVSSYNGRPRPPQVLLDPDGTLRLGRRRGTI